MSLQQNIWNNENIVKVLQENHVVVMPTDTLYGIVGKAFNSEVVDRIYLARKRAPEKPCIILIGDISELEKFSINLSIEQKKVIESLDVPTSFILDCPNEEFTYLHRGTNTLAFRLPAQQQLRELLIKIGPLIAPSANIEGMPSAQNITEAKEYFWDSVDLYVDGGEITREASKVIKLEKNGAVIVLRD